LDLIDFYTRKKIGYVPWFIENQTAKTTPFHINCTKFSGSKVDDFLIAGGTNMSEFKVYEKDKVNKIDYVLGWSVSNLKRGVFSCDISHNYSNIIFGGCDKNLYILNSRKLT